MSESVVFEFYMYRYDYRDGQGLYLITTVSQIVVCLGLKIIQAKNIDNDDGWSLVRKSVVRETLLCIQIAYA